MATSGDDTLKCLMCDPKMAESDTSSASWWPAPPNSSSPPTTTPLRRSCWAVMMMAVTSCVDCGAEGDYLVWEAHGVEWVNFVDFYNCWNDYQEDRSTQVFILCDKPKDANLILISFRSTEPFDADDWNTDFDYSWYEIPKLGKVHMGFLEALGLGNRVNTSTFQNLLQVKGTKFNYLNGVDTTTEPSESNAESEGLVNDGEKTVIPEMVEMAAYFAVKSKLKSLLNEHKTAKFIVTGHSLGGALAILFPTEGASQGEGTYAKKVDEEPNRNYFRIWYLIPENLNAVWELITSLIITRTRLQGRVVVGIAQGCRTGSPWYFSTQPHKLCQLYKAGKWQCRLHVLSIEGYRHYDEIQIAIK
ncbi:alpha/beta-Hydrolases superfamily protein [Actinidia rufa]|uniref:Alpha/beta-Hydrolases superfamily protein n=1 Tax=Actinidia rufa TaxID=165716 RepID=A0A7J0G0S7_9ERIC|nr:alpha/beta-Hydrolases superfamily protein [Actinidia rufa]